MEILASPQYGTSLANTQSHATKLALLFYIRDKMEHSRAHSGAAMVFF